MLAANWSATLGRASGDDQHVAARHLDLVLQHERDRLALDGAVEIAVLGDDALDPRGLAGLGDDDLVALRRSSRRRSCRQSRGSRGWGGSRIAPGSGTARSAASSSTTIVSRCSSSVGPEYQRICSERLVTLSPKRADIGIGVIEAKPRLAANAA